MKKIMMTMAAMFVAVCASAQVYIGGSAALGGQKHGDGDSKMYYKLMPEIGYQFNKTWDAGLSVGYAGVEDGNNAFVIAPYARYTFVNTKLVDLFLEDRMGYGHIGGNGADADINADMATMPYPHFLFLQNSAQLAHSFACTTLQVGEVLSPYAHRRFGVDKVYVHRWAHVMD